MAWQACRGPANSLNVPSFISSLVAASQQSPLSNAQIAGMPILLIEQGQMPCPAQLSCYKYGRMRCKQTWTTLQIETHAYPGAPILLAKQACKLWPAHRSKQHATPLRGAHLGRQPSGASDIGRQNTACSHMLCQAQPHGSPSGHAGFTMPAHLSPHAGTPHSGSGEATSSASGALHTHLIQGCLRRGRGGGCQQAAVVPHCSQHAQSLAARQACCVT